MYSHLQLRRRVNHIISFLDPDQREAEEIDEEIMHTLCNLHRVFPGWTICTCRFMHTNFFYVSDNFRDLLGLEPATGIEAFHLDSFFDRVHPADAADFNKGIHLLEALLKKEDPADHHRFRFVFHYRVLHTDGRYICIHDEKAVIRLKNGRCLYFMLLKDISHENTYAGFKMTAYKEGYSEKVLEYYAAAEASAQLTPRESELIPLMKQGLSIKEAAACLGISPNTVRNMRQKLFEKFQVNNVIELLNRLDVNGLATAV
ncbi:LuxR C-terminal-related transcriptional regulator [uncultured Chitinophaga sp.]|jgi:Response regulator containing a CheY-like receiver domain and an HTH DNA-binding domain|uniref:helix-turn-helix transcriptional regulator n=1 Tax=uncultured Chitinophaga sp. TaxID=339340 RepID=UPI002626101A|nr:LuxR C-terminal-related transcriptional regulator [uncultured Chitinophaga sp.]